MKKNNIIILAVVAAVSIIGLVIALIVKGNEMEEMEEVFAEQKEMLVGEYESLYSDFDSLRSNNQELEDKLLLERERVAQLQEELRTVKTTNARRIKELQAELSTMRGVMRTFVVQIDSLNQVNQQLAKRNSEVNSQLAKATSANQELEKEKAELAHKVNIAAKLEAKNIEVSGLTIKQKVTTRFGSVSSIKVDFVLMKNVAAEVGMRPVYVRIERPDGQLLMHSRSDVFAFEDSQINFSARNDVEYGGDDTSAYVVYNVDSGELMEGIYNVELFCGGERIGSKTFKLK